MQLSVRSIQTNSKNRSNQNTTEANVSEVDDVWMTSNCGQRYDLKNFSFSLHTENLSQCFLSIFKRKSIVERVKGPIQELLLLLLKAFFKPSPSVSQALCKRAHPVSITVFSSGGM